MSQNDLVIANQSAPDFRSDLNDALQALGSLNSGSTAPSTTYANMLWYDTSNNILKMRSEADDAWVSVGYIDQSANAFRVLDDTQVTNTSGTQTGLLGDQATATWEAGTGTTESLVSPAKIKAAIDALTTTPDPSGLIPISTVSASGTSTLAFTGFDSTKYESYLIVISGLLPSADTTFQFDFSTDGGSTWTEGITNNPSGPNYDLTSSSVGRNASTEGGIFGTMEIPRPDLTSPTHARGVISYIERSTLYDERAAAYLDSASGVDGVRFRTSSANIAGGSFTVYGRTKP